MERRGEDDKEITWHSCMLQHKETNKYDTMRENAGSIAKAYFFGCWSSDPMEQISLPHLLIKYLYHPNFISRESKNEDVINTCLLDNINYSSQKFPSCFQCYYYHYPQSQALPPKMSTRWAIEISTSHNNFSALSSLPLNISFFIVLFSLPLDEGQFHSLL